MRRLEGNDRNLDRVIHKIFMNQLPLSVRRILAPPSVVTHSNRNLDELAAIADRVVAEDRRALPLVTVPNNTSYNTASGGMRDQQLSSIHDNSTSWVVS